MNRRDFVKNTSMLGALALITGPSVLLGSSKKELPTIAQIIDTSFPDVLNVMRDGSHFVSPTLRSLERSSRLMVMSLGESVLDLNTGKTHEIEELSIPVAWSVNDDLNNDLEERMNLSQSLMENAIEAHDDYLLYRLGSGKAVVSKQYTYDKGETFFTPDKQSLYFSLRTAIVFY